MIKNNEIIRVRSDSTKDRAFALYTANQGLIFSISYGQSPKACQE